MVKLPNVKILFFQLLFCLLLLLGWEVAGRTSRMVFFLVGTPGAMFREMRQLLLVDHLLRHFWITGSEATVGLLIGTFVGASIGLCLWYSETLAKTARPFIIALATLPIFAFAPLMIVWFGIGWGMKVALAAFSTVFVAFDQAYRGANLTSKDSVDVLKGMKASQHQIFSKVVVPGALDWVLSSMRLNVGFGLLGAFIGEFIAADQGLGYLILRASGLYNIPRAFAAAMGITILAFILNAIAWYIETHRRFLVQILSVPRLVWK
jgi:NitT/TauT family transport system permease protein